MTVFSSNFFSYKKLQKCYQLLCISFLSISVTLIYASGVLRKQEAEKSYRRALMLQRFQLKQ